MILKDKLSCIDLAKDTNQQTAADAFGITGRYVHKLLQQEDALRAQLADAQKADAEANIVREFNTKRGKQKIRLRTNENRLLRKTVVLEEKPHGKPRVPIAD